MIEHCLQHRAQVALMFLTRGYVQHHDTWKLWFEDVQGMLPLSAMQVQQMHTPSALFKHSTHAPNPWKCVPILTGPNAGRLLGARQRRSVRRGTHVA